MNWRQIVFRQMATIRANFEKQTQNVNLEFFFEVIHPNPYPYILSF